MTVFAGAYAKLQVSGGGVFHAAQPLNNTDGGAYLAYQVSNESHQVFDPRAAVTVYVDAAAQPASAYTLDRLFGRVTFKAALTGANVVTADITYLPMTVVAEANSAELSHTCQSLDSTTFLSGGYTERDYGLSDASGTIGRFYAADGLFVDAVQAGEVICVEYWRDTNDVDWRAWALFDKADVKGTPSDLTSESATWVGSADADGRSVSYA